MDNSKKTRPEDTQDIDVTISTEKSNKEKGVLCIHSKAFARFVCDANHFHISGPKDGQINDDILIKETGCTEAKFSMSGHVYLSFTSERNINESNVIDGFMRAANHIKPIAQANAIERANKALRPYGRHITA